MELWELTARERIRDCLATYSWSGDAMRLDDFVTAFCDDGELEVRGTPAVKGRAAIAEFIGGVGTSAPASGPAAPTGFRIVRHNVANVRFLEVSRDSARVASYFTVFTEIGLDHFGRYRDTFVPAGDRWLIRHRFVSTDWAAPNSTMAAGGSAR